MDDSLGTVSLRRLQVFLTVSETLHVARAAERMGITQPALSQQIQALERALAVRLFHRRKRGIELTEAGRACRLEAQRLLAAHGALIDTVQRTARGETGRINLGHVGSVVFGQRFPQQLKTMQQRLPDVKLSLRQANLAELLPAVRTGDLDIALVSAPAHLDVPLAHCVHSRQDLVVALPRNHPLVESNEISVERLAEEPMIGLQGSDDVGVSRVVSQFAAAAGVQLRIEWQVPEVNGVLGLVAAGLGYGIVPQDLTRLAGGDIAFRALAAPAPHIDYLLVWNELRVSPALRQFLDLVAE